MLQLKIWGPHGPLLGKVGGPMGPERPYGARPLTWERPSAPTAAPRFCTLRFRFPVALGDPFKGLYRVARCARRASYRAYRAYRENCYKNLEKSSLHRIFLNFSGFRFFFLGFYV